MKESARAAVDQLHRQGVRTVMLTGDGWGAANVVAESLGIDEVVAQVLPEGKADAVARLRGKGKASRWSATASTMPRRSPRRTSASPWRQERTWPCTPLASP
ncbi:HAD family hydrolase [Limobrevibacterium gyesilva]|uniref:HAD family hydrolase n=1 Tax=Limobrevibacterium gyesilva TaxID=2991712 RepID=UPI0038D0F99E